MEKSMEVPLKKLKTATSQVTLVVKNPPANEEDAKKTKT